MVTTSLDTLLACSVMVVLVLFSMVGVLTVVHPYLQNQPYGYREEMNHMVAEYLLLEPGTPSNWGSRTNTSLTSFGLARANGTIPFELDTDKVTRLNQENFYNMSFLEVFRALGAQDKSFRIRIEPVFDITVNLTSKVERLTDTVYYFDIYTKRSRLPITVNLRCYTVLGDYAVNTTTSTSNLGVGSVNATLPNYLNGTALLVTIARAEPRTMSYAVYAFKHNSESEPHPQRTYARLSPVDHMLRADLSSQLDRVLYAKVFTYSYSFNLAQINETLSVQFYDVPRLLDVSPMILAAMGYNTSKVTLFAEWVAYPQMPLEFGANFTGEHDVMNSYSFSFLVTINSALYKCEVILGGT